MEKKFETLLKIKYGSLNPKVNLEPDFFTGFDPEKALASLKEADYLCKLIDVLGVEVADEVGNLNELLKALSDSNVSAEYIYLSFNRDSGKPIMVLYTDDIYEVECCLKSKGFAML